MGYVRCRSCLSVPGLWRSLCIQCKSHHCQSSKQYRVAKWSAMHRKRDLFFWVCPWWMGRKQLCRKSSCRCHMFWSRLVIVHFKEQIIINNNQNCNSGLIILGQNTSQSVKHTFKMGPTFPFFLISQNNQRMMVSTENLTTAKLTASLSSTKCR